MCLYDEREIYLIKKQKQTNKFVLWPPTILGRMVSREAVHKHLFKPVGSLLTFNLFNKVAQNGPLARYEQIEIYYSSCINHKMTKYSHFVASERILRSLLSSADGHWIFSERGHVAGADPGFPRQWAPTPKVRYQPIILVIFLENCMKMRKVLDEEERQGPNG